MKRYRYEFIVDGEVKDRITCNSLEDLMKCIKILKPFERELYSLNPEKEKKQDG